MKAAEEGRRVPRRVLGRRRADVLDVGEGHRILRARLMEEGDSTSCEMLELAPPPTSALLQGLGRLGLLVAVPDHCVQRSPKMSSRTSSTTVRTSWAVAPRW
jgi:hypothetical protein